MFKKVMKSFLALAIITVMLFNLPVVAFAQTNDVTYGEIQPVSMKRLEYFSERPADDEDYLTKSNEVAELLRSAMINSETELTIKFAFEGEFTQSVFSALVSDWFEKALAECEKSNGGDYLRFRYAGYATKGGTYWSRDGKCFCTIPLVIEYYSNTAQEEIVALAIKDVITSFGFTENTGDKAKCDAIYDFITKNVSYDYDNLYDPNYNLKFSAYAALINGKSVCQGYATLFYRIARECGLETRIITGISNGEHHAWNIVKIDGAWYYVDSTWDAGKKTFKYYLKGSEEFSSHDSDAMYTSPDFVNRYPISKTSYKMPVGSCMGDHTYDNPIDRTCNACGYVREIVGEHFVEQDGVWYYYVNGELFEGKELIKINGEWKYIEDGVWATNVDTLHKINGMWFLIKGGVWKSATRLVEYKGKIFYVKGGKWESRNDVIKIDGKYHYIKGGKWDSTITDLVKVNKKWYFIQNGLWDSSAESLFKINGKWFLIKEGMWNSATRIVEYKGKMFYVKGGKWESRNDIVKLNGKYYYIKGGKWDKTQTTLFKKDGKYRAVKNGMWYKGKNIIKYNGKKYYVNDGYAKTSYSGKVTINGKKYTVKKGIIK